jgi:hypothetical protein
MAFVPAGKLLALPPGDKPIAVNNNNNNNNNNYYYYY